MNDVNTAHHRANHLIADATIHAISDCQARKEGEDEAKAAMVELIRQQYNHKDEQANNLTNNKHHRPSRNDYHSTTSSNMCHA